MMGAAGLQCAVCHHVRFLWNESEKFDNEPGVPEIRQAVTIMGGTAVCGLHIEDLDRAQNGWLLRIAGNILGVPVPRRR